MSELDPVEAALVEAGFLDAYLNIVGVKDEAEAWKMLREDYAALKEAGWSLERAGLREALDALHIEPKKARRQEDDEYGQGFDQGWNSALDRVSDL